MITVWPTGDLIDYTMSNHDSILRKISDTKVNHESIHMTLGQRPMYNNDK